MHRAKATTRRKQSDNIAMMRLKLKQKKMHNTAKLLSERKIILPKNWKQLYPHPVLTNQPPICPGDI